MRWLDTNRRAPGRQVVVHGDFRLGNLIMGPEGLRAVVDWELAHLGDPMEDLAWLCVKTWRFGQPQPVAGICEYPDLLGPYEEATDIPVDRQVLAWWEVLGHLKWGVICLMQAELHQSGQTRSHELAAVGRRASAAAHDLSAILP